MKGKEQVTRVTMGNRGRQEKQGLTRGNKGNKG